MGWFAYLPLHKAFACLEGEYGGVVAANERQRVRVLVQRKARLAAQIAIQRERGLAGGAGPARARLAVQLQLNAVCAHYVHTMHYSSSLSARGYLPHFSQSLTKQNITASY